MEKLNKWLKIGTAGDSVVWVRRSQFSFIDPQVPASNSFLVLQGETPPAMGSPGFRNLKPLLSAKGLLNEFRPSKAFIPDGWVCACAVSKKLMPGAVYETTMGDVELNQAPYDMTILVSPSGEGFIPVHGEAAMPECSTARDAAKALAEYWRNLPYSLRTMSDPALYRDHGSLRMAFA